MKKTMILIFIMAALLLLVSCAKETQNDAGNITNTPKQSGESANETEDETAPQTEEGFCFKVNDVVIPMNVDAAPIIEALGEADSYFEAPSCAFQGLDKIYSYSGFEINTYPNGEKDYISSVYLKDDSVETDKGICIGSTLDEVIEAYGDDYTEKSGEYVYTSGQTRLSFLIGDGCVSAITYSAIVEGLDN